MHIMVNKRYMWKCDACVGHEARMNKLLFKEAPGLMSADSASLYEPLKAIRERGEGEKCKTEKYKKGWTEEGDEHRVRR